MAKITLVKTLADGREFDVNVYSQEHAERLLQDPRYSPARPTNLDQDVESSDGEDVPADGEVSNDKDVLVAEAHELGLGAPSQLSRWSVETLKQRIAEARE